MVARDDEPLIRENHKTVCPFYLSEGIADLFELVGFGASGDKMKDDLGIARGLENGP